MIIIKLSEFKVSSQDLDQTRIIFFQTKTAILPVTNLKITNQLLILISETNQKVLTLAQFNQQTNLNNQNIQIYLNQPKRLRIFGYRLENNQIIFG